MTPGEKASSATPALPLCADCANYAPNRRPTQRSGRPDFPPNRVAIGWGPDIRQPLSGYDCHRATGEIDLVTGEVVFDSKGQQWERSHGPLVCRVLRTCGRAGRFFTPASARDGRT